MCSTARSCGRRMGRLPNIVVVMAKVPKSEGHRGGITAFVLPYKTEGVTVTHRNSVYGYAWDRELGDGVARMCSCRRRTGSRRRGMGCGSR